MGSLPDMLLPTKDCKTVVVAIEAEAYFYNGAIFDPQGGVGILKFEDDVSFKKLDFKEFDKRFDILSRIRLFCKTKNKHYILKVFQIY